MEAARLAVLAHGAAVAGGDPDAVVAAQAALAMNAAGAAASAAAASAAVAAAASATKTRKPYKKREAKDPGAGNRPVLPRKNASAASKQKVNLPMNVQGGALELALVNAGLTLPLASSSSISSKAKQPAAAAVQAAVI
jgi:hypothetical protein